MQSVTNPESESAQPKRLTERPFFAGFLFFAAVLLPAASFTIEIASGWCAEVFFDPMPTWWHVLLVAFVPVTNFQTWRAIKRRRTERLNYLSFANALVFFISLFYTIVYAPLLPISVVALLLMGLGVLGMTPIFALIGTILLRRELHKLQPEQKLFGLRWAGLGAALTAVLALATVAELPFYLTRYGMQMAVSEDAATQNRGLQFLRRFGDDDYLLRKCYAGSGVATLEFISPDVFWNDFGGSTNRRFSPERAREIYYRLHGRAYNSVSAPRGTKSWERETATDLTSDAEAANNRLNQGLTLAGSTIDGSIDGDAMLSYLEWTLTVKNEKQWQQEATAHIQLPPDAVVSRLTLWINGEEREAAFAGRERVTRAYESVVSKRRDPVLVTTAGRDRISVRAFPVPPSGEMKFRIGITAPLQTESETAGLLLLPYFNERNFAVGAEHSIWIESKKPLEAVNPAFTIEQRENLSAVRGKIRNQDLSRTGAPVRAPKSSEIKTVWTRLAPGTNQIVRQDVAEKTEEKPANLIFVVDAGARMKDFQPEIAEAVRRLPGDLKTALVLTGGNGLNLQEAAPNSFAGSPLEIAARIERATFAGGSDSTPALERAWDISDQMPSSAIVWIHAAQPLKLSSADPLKQRFQRRPSSAPVYSLQTANGASAVAREIDGFGKVRTVPRFGNLSDDLSRFLAGLNLDSATAQPVKRFSVVRRIETAANGQNIVGAKETSAHLARLWANEEVSRLLENNEDRAALELAVKNQLVTPVSGAVVLETAEQYEQFGLKPVDANTVPTIPEPEEYLLFAIVLMILAWLGWRYRFAARRTGDAAAR